MKRAAQAIGGAILGTLASCLGGCSALLAIEEPRHAIELGDGDFEVRRYEARVVAETRVSGDWHEAGSAGFRRLASYIFGENRARSELAMTAPVSQARDARRIPMTAPVGMAAGDEGWVVTFTMPRGETLQTLPVPDDPRVVLREVPASRVAVVRFRGAWSERRFDDRTAALCEWALAKGFELTGAPETNRYDPPWTPWFLRRNEIWWPLAPPAP